MLLAPDYFKVKLAARNKEENSTALGMVQMHHIERYIKRTKSLYLSAHHTSVQVLGILTKGKPHMRNMLITDIIITMIPFFVTSDICKLNRSPNVN